MCIPSPRQPTTASPIAPGPSRTGWRTPELPSLLPPRGRLYCGRLTEQSGRRSEGARPRPEMVVRVWCLSVAHGGTAGEVAEKFGSGLRRPLGSLPGVAWSGIVARWICEGCGSRFVSNVPLPWQREFPQGARRPGLVQGRGGARRRVKQPGPLSSSLSCGGPHSQSGAGRRVCQQSPCLRLPDP